MENEFTVVWSFRNRIDTLTSSILQAHETCPEDVDFVLVDAASDEYTIRNLRTFCNSLGDRTVRICESAYRSTLAEAWNLGMMLTPNRYVIFFSSDTMIQCSGWFEAMHAAVIQHKLEYVLMQTHALFCVDKRVIPKLGWFDEEYFIGPHFDTDYMIRAGEAGVKFAVIGNPGFYTHGDASEVTDKRKDEELKDRLPLSDRRNDNVFKDKWETDWPGWQEFVHPPNSIDAVTRKRPEVDPHPFYTRKCV